MGEPIAVIGIGCRFPGANGPRELWELLCDGRDAVTEVPADRFDVAAVYDPRPGTPGRIPTRAGGFIDRIDEFDAEFFGISAREAAHMDPQQRLLLETGWEAVEDAGVRPGPRTGVFIGQMTSNYWDLLYLAQALDIYTNIGTTRSALAGRLSYALDLRGPSIAVDAACSSSLVAVHLAVQSLRQGECDVALAGGVNLILHAAETVTFAQAKMISPRGRCAFGSDTADGFIRSDGVGVVMLKRLSSALADGDRPYALIHGSAVGNDGRASGLLMTPARDGQADTIRAAYADAGIDPAQVGYVEAHGTGSAAGDPVELAGLAAVFDHPLLVGSVKTNIGHTEAAAGVAGLIKAVLCVQHREIPPSLHGGPVGGGVTIPRERTPWRAGAAYAGVSSFGISGTNAHVVIGEAPARPPVEAPGPHLLVMSARTPEALRDLAAAYAAHPLTPLADACYTAATRRHHECRLTVVGADPTEMSAKLRAHLAGEPVPSLGTADEVSDGDKARVVFVFPGQGSQWTGMGRELLRSSPAFAEAMASCDAAIQAEAGWSVREMITDAAVEDAGIERIQPALWAMEVSLAAAWRAYGIEPDVVIGHSMGEVAAACVAGLLDLADGAVVICRRAALLATIAGHGAMLSVELPAADVQREIADVSALVSVAVSNGPRSTVLAGDPAALDRIAGRLADRDVFCRRVQVEVASHSPQVDPLLVPLADALGTVRPRPGTTPMFSTVVGGEVSDVDGGYWARNLREPVRFGEAVEAVKAQGPAVFVEISPHPLLTGAVDEVPGAGCATVPSLRRGEPELAGLLDGLGALYRAGHPVPWHTVYGAGRQVARLPGYPWQRRRYWLDGDAGRPSGSGYEHRVDQPYLTEHRVQGEPVLPGTAYLEAVLAAVPGSALHDVTFHHPLVLTGGPAALRVTRTADRFEVTAGQVVHVTGGLAPMPAVGPTRDAPVIEGERITGDDFYARSAAAGNQWGGPFRGVAELWRDGRGRALARVEPSPGAAFPAVLDACCQVLSAADRHRPFLLAGIGAVRLYRPLGDRTLWSHATGVVEGGSLTGDVVVTDTDGTVVAELTGVRLRYLEPARPRGLYEVRWVERPPLAAGPAPGTWLVFAEEADGGELAARLRAAHHRCAVVTAGEGYAQPAPDRFVIDRTRAEDHRRVLAATGAADVVHLWSLSARDATDAVSGALLLSQAMPGGRLWLVTRGAQPAGGCRVAPDQAAVWGFGRALGQERPDLDTTLVDLDLSTSDVLYAEVTGCGDGEREIALRAGARWAARLTRYEPRVTVDSTIEIGTETPGLIDAVRSRPVAAPVPGPGEVVVRTRSAALNYRDVLLAMDAYPGADGAPARLGWECAGTVVALGAQVAGVGIGDEVVAVANPALAGQVRADARLVLPRPPGLGAAEAATLPMAYLTAWYALCDLARLQPGERVLIHSATGGVGLAAIQVARWKGAEILATAGHGGKRALLRTLGVTHVFDSRSAAFADEVRSATLGAGVDVVLNTLTGDAAAANLPLLAPYGRYVELAKRDARDGARLDPRSGAGNLAYFAVDVADMVSRRPAQAARILREVLGLVQAGVLPPLPYTEFAAADAVEAFRRLALAQHVGKLVVTFDDASGAGASGGEGSGAGASGGEGSAPVCDPGGTYLVTGGLGDLGRVLARWLVDNGARHLLLIGRTPRPSDPTVDELARRGVDVVYEAVDVADEAALRDVLARRQRAGRPPVRGVVHAAGVVAFRPVDELTPDEVSDVLRPKVAGGWALHRVLRDTPLDFFVLFSSGAAVLGSPMLSAYAAANAFLDGLAHHRRASGLPALAVDWGYWSGTGMAARFAIEHGRPLVPHGMTAFGPAEGTEALRELMASSAIQALVLPADWERWRAAHPEAARTPLLRALLLDAGPADPPPAPPAPPAPPVPPAPAPDRAAGVLNGQTVEEYLIGQVATVLGVPVPRVSTRRPLTAQGIDSLMAVEIRTRVRRDLGVLLPVTRILSNRTVTEVAADLSTRLATDPSTQDRT